MFRQIAAMVLLAAGMALGTACDNPAPQTKKIRLAVVPKGTAHSFWKSVEAGARKAEKELDVEIVWKGPLKENQVNEQVGIVEQFAAEGVAGIALAPQDFQALYAPVKSAMEKKIPVVIFDSGLNGTAGKDYISYIATDNKQAGRLGGEALSKALGGKGKVLLLRYQVGSASTMEREAGFLEAIAKHAELKVISENQHAGESVDKAKTASLNMIDKIREADGIFCPNESTAVGMLLALQESNLAGKKKFVGFDASQALVKGLRAGQIDALVIQDPQRMGYESVKTLVAHIKGSSVPQVIDTGAKVVTSQMLGDEKIKEMIGAEALKE